MKKMGNKKTRSKIAPRITQVVNRVTFLDFFRSPRNEVSVVAI